MTRLGALILSSWSSVALASGSAHDNHEINWLELSGQTVTFLVFLVGLLVLARKPMAKFFLDRHHAVKTAVEEAQRAKAEAEAKFKEYSQKLAEIDLEAKKLADGFRAAAEGERQRLLAEADLAAKRLKEEAEAAIAYELQKAQAQLAADAADAAVKLAEDLLRREIKPEDHDRLVKDYIQSLAPGKKKQAA